MQASPMTSTFGARWPSFLFCALALGWLAPAMAATNTSYWPGPVDYDALP